MRFPHLSNRVPVHNPIVSWNKSREWYFSLSRTYSVSGWGSVKNMTSLNGRYATTVSTEGKPLQVMSFL